MLLGTKIFISERNDYDMVKNLWYETFLFSDNDIQNIIQKDLHPCMFIDDTLKLHVLIVFYEFLQWVEQVSYK